MVPILITVSVAATVVAGPHHHLCLAVDHHRLRLGKGALLDRALPGAVAWSHPLGGEDNIVVFSDPGIHIRRYMPRVVF